MKTDQFDWEITSGPSSSTLLSGKRASRGTPTNVTGIHLGPLNDHTLGNADGSYAYVDTGKNRKINDTAILISQSMSNSASSGMCLEFFYHM